MTHEGLHHLKTLNLKGSVIKIDLSKSYDHVNWIYIGMFITHLGFNYNFIKWIMSYISYVSFAVVINGEASNFFHSERGLGHGCPLSPLLFLLVVEGFSRFLS